MKKVIVAGAGILGAVTAYQLARNGAEVIVIDKNTQGQATSAAAGIVCPWLSQRRNKAWYKLAKGGAKIYPSIIKQLADDGERNTGYSQVGAICLHTDSKKLKDMEKRAYKRREDAPEIGSITLLNETETNNIFPLLDEGYHAVHVSGAARVNGLHFKNALLNGARKHGARIINGTAEIIHNQQKVTGVSVNQTNIYADVVIAANGVWMNELLKPLHVIFDVTPQKAQIIHLQTMKVHTNNLPVIMPPNDQYFVPFSDGRVVIGATHENDAGMDYRITAGGMNEILTKALDICPGLSDSTVLETRIGFRPFTPGFLPVIGPLPGFKGLLLANGLGASGLTMGPYIGTELAKLALDQKLEIDLSDYDVAGAINMEEKGPYKK